MHKPLFILTILTSPLHLASMENTSSTHSDAYTHEGKVTERIIIAHEHSNYINYLKTRERFNTTNDSFNSSEFIFDPAHATEILVKYAHDITQDILAPNRQQLLDTLEEKEHIPYATRMIYLEQSADAAEVCVAIKMIKFLQNHPSDSNVLTAIQKLNYFVTNNMFHAAQARYNLPISLTKIIEADSPPTKKRSLEKSSNNNNNTISTPTPIKAPTLPSDHIFANAIITVPSTTTSTSAPKRSFNQLDDAHIDTGSSDNEWLCEPFYHVTQNMLKPMTEKQ